MMSVALVSGKHGRFVEKIEDLMEVRFNQIPKMFIDIIGGAIRLRLFPELNS